jgi:hypothetical protein
LTNALKDIGRGMSVAKAAKSHEIPLRTMYDQDRKRSKSIYFYFNNKYIYKEIYLNSFRVLLFFSELCVESCNKIEELKKLKNKGSSSSSAASSQATIPCDVVLSQD